ncbi:MAG: hypothetical protein F6K03_05015 [Kamptonema sp. SIO4C4]|nr:hypothetical protein [Kamptonema sp. SIO4C4]
MRFFRGANLRQRRGAFLVSRGYRQQEMSLTEKRQRAAPPSENRAISLSFNKV